MEASLTVSIVAALLSGWAVYKSHQANQIAQTSNSIASESNTIAKEANDISKGSAEREELLVKHQMAATLVFDGQGTTRTIRGDHYEFGTSFRIYNRGLGPIKITGVIIEFVVEEKVYYSKEISLKAILSPNPPENWTPISDAFSVPVTTPIESSRFRLSALYIDPITAEIKKFTESL